MTPSEAPARLPRPPDNRRRVSVAAILVLSFSTLIALAVGGVLAVSVGANWRNTTDLLGARSSLLIDGMEDQLRGHMSRAESAVSGIARLYGEDAFDIDDGEKMRSVLSGALAAAPEAVAMIIYTDDDVHRGVIRHTLDNGDTLIKPTEPEKETEPRIIAAMQQRRHVDGVRWGSFVSNAYGLFANVSVPLERDGKIAGYVIAPVDLRTLSGFTEDLSRRFDTTAFILDGDGNILAHPRLANPEPGDRNARPLVPLSVFSDPVLKNFARRTPVEALEETRLPDVEVSEITVDEASGPRSYVTMTRKIEGYSNDPWIIGAYFPRRELDQELRRVTWSALIGLGGLLAAIAAAILLGKRLSRPVTAIAGQAQRVAAFELDDVTPLPRSRVRELDDQATAFNAMLVGLRAFSTYIPRSLVAKLVRSGESAAEPHEAIVTVMFTDIANFTSLSEHMGAADTARALNRHFEILCRAVGDQDGTVDKFLGDGMMAFFGAPDRVKGHAAAAVRAAAQIREAMAVEAVDAAREGRPVFRLRIGIHTGPVTVGNIGGSDRVNYTIIGDTVNVSQRLQGLGKELAPDQPTAIVISAETASRLDERFETIPAGEHALRGRGEPMEVFLVGKVDLTVSQREDAEAA